MDEKNIEQGVDQFARILEISQEEAERVYELIGKYQAIVMHEVSLASELSRFAMRWNSQETLAQLEYVKNHFIGDLSHNWQKRIRVLKGEPDEYMEYLQGLLDTQAREEEIERLKRENDLIRNENGRLRELVKGAVEGE